MGVLLRQPERPYAPARRAATARRRPFELLLGNPGALDDLGPALRLRSVEGLQLGRRAGARLDAELGEALVQVRRGERLDHRVVQLVEDRLWRLGRRGERVPRGDVVAFDARLDR